MTYFGTKAIAKRLGICTLTFYRWLQDDGLLAYKGRMPNSPRECWVTNDDLINIWLVAKCKRSRARFLTERAERVKVKQERLGISGAEPGEQAAIHEGPTSQPEVKPNHE